MVRFSRLVPVVFLALFTLLLTSPESRGEYSPAADLNADGIIDSLDVFLAAGAWMSDSETGIQEDGLRGLLGGWHTAGSPGGERVLGIPRSVAEGSFGSYTGTIPITLSDAGGMKKIEMGIPYLINNQGYNITMGLNGNTTGLITSTFTVSNQLAIIPGTSTFMLKVTLTGSGPLPAGSSGTIYNLPYSAFGPSPVTPREIPVDFVADTVVLRDGSDSILPVTTQGGAIVIGPPPPPTPTATATPNPANDLVAGLRLRACYDRTRTQNHINLFMDQIDADGNIVNPGIDGVTKKSVFTARVTKGGRFGNGENNYTSDVAFATGRFFSVTDATAETVVVTVESPEFASPDPIELTFFPSGGLRGTIRVFDSQQNGYRPATVNDVSIYVNPSEHDDIPFSGTVIGPNNGQYFVVGLKPDDNYHLRFDGNRSTTDPTAVIDAKCIDGIQVRARQVTPDVNVDLPLVSGTGKITGTIMTVSGVPVRSFSVGASPDGEPLCSQYEVETMNGFQTDTYLLEYVRPAAYTLRAYSAIAGANPESLRLFDLVADYVVNVSEGETVVQDIIIDEVVPITHISPVEYALVDAPPTIRWSVPEGSPDFTYSLTITSLCGSSRYVESISGTEFTDNVTVYDPDALYFYQVIGTHPSGKKASPAAYRSAVEAQKLPWFRIRQ